MSSGVGFGPGSRCRYAPKCPAFSWLPEVRRAIGYGNEPPGALCSHPIVALGSEHMKQSTVQLISFLVLGAVVLATGFGAIGGPAMLAGGF